MHHGDFHPACAAVIMSGMFRPPPTVLFLLASALATTLAAQSAPASPAAQSAPATQAAPAVAPAFQPTRFIVQVAGSGPDVIMIPGLGSSRDVWKTEAAKLAPHYRLHLIQIRGFAGYKTGPNDKDPLLTPIVTELAQYIEAGHLDKPAIIGHSLGGTLGLMLAAEHPQDVGKLMVVDALPFLAVLIDPKATVDFIRPQAQEMRKNLVEATTNDFLMSEKGQIATLVKSPDQRTLVTFWTINSDRKTLGNALYDDMTTDLRPQMSKIQVPITLLYPYDAGGQSSKKDVDKMYHDAYATAPHAMLVRIDDSAHFIMLDQPQKFDDAVQTFLKS